MKSTHVNDSFPNIITLIKKASTQDVMLVNETSPAMVRFLDSGNRFRTLQLDDIKKTSTQIQTTKSDDPESVLDDFKVFLDVRQTEESEIQEETAAKEKADLEAQKNAAQDHKDALERRRLGLEPDEPLPEKKEVVVKPPKKKVIASGKKKTSKKQKQKKATKKKATKKKASKKKTTKKKK